MSERGHNRIDEAVRMLRDAQLIVVLTGAGVSAESGLDTFRDSGEGLWSKYDPTRLATPEAFQADPELVTRWYDWRRLRCAEAEPNAGHGALARLQERCEHAGREFTLLTQNVDRLHHAAGSRDVVELHGTLWEWRCVRCGESKEERGPAFEGYPLRCACGGLRRPGVVWFGEALPSDAIERAQQAIGSCDLFLSVGTSAMVYPAAGFARTARQHGAATIEVNRDPTPISALVDVSIQGRSGEVLPGLVDRALPE